jgi:hypothetical protein
MDTPSSPGKSATQTRNPAGWDEQAPVFFPDWKEALRGSDLDNGSRGSRWRAILGFLKHCQDLRCPASGGVARRYLDLRKNSGTPVPGGPVRPDRPVEEIPVPLPGDLDRGKSEWEAALIREICIRTVQDLLGHQSGETTQIYLHVMKKPGLPPSPGLRRTRRLASRVRPASKPSV